MAAPKIDPFMDGEAMELNEAEAQELGGAEGGEQQAAPETPDVGAQQAEATPDGKEPAAIPYPRFKEVNEAKRAAEQRLGEAEKERNELRERWARLDERRNQLTEAQQQANAQAQQARVAAERPDPTIDPLGAQMYDQDLKVRQLEQAYSALQNQMQQNVGNLQQTQQQTEFNTWVQYQAQDYARQDPQYFEKANKAATWRTNFWMKTGMAEADARERVGQESLLIAAQCRQNGVNFAPLIAELSDVLDIMAQRQNGGTQQQQGNNNAQKLAQIQAGQRVQGLGHLPGSSGENTIGYRNYSASQIANMSEAEFARAMSSAKSKKDIEYALAIAEGIDPSQMGRM